MTKEFRRKPNKHNMCGTPTYRSWAMMRNRCNNKNHHKYNSYGGRGIKVCDRWFEFLNFYEDMGLRPIGKTLDRIDNNGDYYPENCKWSTNSEQQRNTRANRMVIHQGREWCIAELAAKYKINHNVLLYRIFTAKWSVERSVSIPSKSRVREAA